MNSSNVIPEVILYSFFPWEHEYPSTAHGLAKALCTYTRVWFVSKPPTWKDLAKGQPGLRPWESPKVVPAPGFGESLMLVDLPATMPINMLSPGGLYNTMQRLVDRSLGKALSTFVKTWDIQAPIWINLYAPTQFKTLPRSVAPRKRFYYSVDAIAEAAYTGKHGAEAERHQLAVADAGFSTSSKLAEDLGAYSKSMHVLPNAMDAANYLAAKSVDEPADLAGIPYPRLGYIGNLDSARLDFEGLLVLAKARPEVQLVLIGPWNAGEEMKQEFLSLKNVHLLGRKTPDECPHYLQHVSAGIIPFRCTALTAAIYPLKINEYLALGLPVLATAFSADIKDFADVIYLAAMPEWVDLLDEVCRASSPNEIESRRNRAAQNRWEDRAAAFLKLAGFTQHFQHA